MVVGVARQFTQGIPPPSRPAPAPAVVFDAAPAAGVAVGFAADDGGVADPGSAVAGLNNCCTLARTAAGSTKFTSSPCGSVPNRTIGSVTNDTCPELSA